MSSGFAWASSWPELLEHFQSFCEYPSQLWIKPKPKLKTDLSCYFFSDPELNLHSYFEDYVGLKNPQPTD